MSSRWKDRIRRLKNETLALYLALKHPRTPWYVKLFIALLVLYAVSPIDFIPDFIPVLGYLDDLVIIAGGFSLALRMVPAEVLRECREQAGSETETPSSWWAAIIIASIWLLVVFFVIRLIIEVVA